MQQTEGCYVSTSVINKIVIVLSGAFVVSFDPVGSSGYRQRQCWAGSAMKALGQSRYVHEQGPTIGGGTGSYGRKESLS